MPSPQYFQSAIEQLASQACTFDTTPPTFAGITSAVPNNDGSITVNWALATSPKPPVDYHIYIALGSVSAATLFDDANVAIHIPPGKITGRIFLLPDETTYLVKGQQYTVGVRANDALDYEDSNNAIQVVTAIASGNLPNILQSIADQTQATEVLLAADHVNFQADHTNFQADHVNFVADDAAFDADHVNFQNDHSNFVADDAAFDADHVNFQNDHSNFQGDHSDLQSDHSDFQGDHSDFQADHADLQSDHSDFQADHVNFQGDHTDLQSDHSDFQSDHTAFQGDHSDFQVDLADLAAENADFVQNNLDLAAAISSLSAITIALAGGGGLGMTLATPELFMTVTIEEVIP